MKKDYVTPKAEKLEFDYIESVVACCSQWPWCVHQWEQNKVKEQQQQQQQQEQQPKRGTNVSTPYWECNLVY